jgi:hypothetical protein
MTGPILPLLVAGGSAWAAAAVPLPAASESSSELQAPVRLQAAGGLVDVTIGHAAPYLYDFDGDGRDDLLVGQFADGKLRIYPNEGTNREPRYGEFVWFHAGGVHGTVPAG